jgi:hypothetical protein
MTRPASPRYAPARGSGTGPFVRLTACSITLPQAGNIGDDEVVPRKASDVQSDVDKATQKILDLDTANNGAEVCPLPS